MTDQDVRGLYVLMSKWAAGSWGIGFMAVLAAIVWLGEGKHLKGTELPPLLTFVFFRVLLFPGLVIAALVAVKLGLVATGTTLVSSSRFDPAVLGLFVAAIVLGGLFWGVVVPWGLTALRVYVWPRRRSRDYRQ